MALSELTLHNVLRTYARQQRIGTALRLRRTSEMAQSPQDRIAVSHKACNLQQIWQVAAEVVGRLHSDLPPLEQLSLTVSLVQKARTQYADELDGEVLPADVLKEWVRSLGGNTSGG